MQKLKYVQYIKIWELCKLYDPKILGRCIETSKTESTNRKEKNPTKVSLNNKSEKYTIIITTNLKTAKHNLT